MNNLNRYWIIGITGASGSVYGVRLIQYLISQEIPVHLIITDAGWRVLHEELGWNAARRQETLQEHFGTRLDAYVYYPVGDIGASIASGSYRNTAGMVIIPCSMGTLSAIAHGASDNLMERAADVMLKEGRPLLLVPRETPLHAIHLENMLKLAQLGVKIIPAMPAYYHQPKTLDELINFMVGKVLDNMQVEHELYQRWGDSK